MPLQNQMQDLQLNEIIQFIHDNQDDEFYQVTCHVDNRLKEKIKKGEFV